jgi:uncharacterized membrane protein YobD (UPF0266 family)
MRNGHFFIKSGLEVKSQNQKKIAIKLNCLFFKNPLLNENQNILTIMLQMMGLWSIFIVIFIQPMLRWRQS